MTAIGPCSWLSAVPLAPIPAMGTIGATDTPALLQRHASFRAGRQSSMARSLCRTHAVYLRGLTGSASLPALTLNFLRLRPVRPPPGRTQGETLGIGQAHQESPIQFSEEFIGDAAAFFRACAAHELEGRSARGFRGKAWQTETGLLRLAGSLHRKNPGVSVLN